ncbi:hypothetical protein BDF14DRAFT_6769 [Spinellus fusiger]|nr:hypothetical protein BDF14DRAFT_6769 [Spinellus fusiger]
MHTSLMLTCDQVKNVLRAILHSIFFHRLLTNVTPRELKILDTTVSITDSAEVDQLVEEKILEFVHHTNGHAQQEKMAVFFYEKRLKKNWFQFSKSDEWVCWEQWTLHISRIYPQNEQERSKAQRAVAKQLSQCLLGILKMANDYKEHIPSITTTEGNPFPFQIATPSKQESWSAMLKRLLVTDAPMTEGQRKVTSNAKSHSLPVPGSATER